MEEEYNDIFTGYENDLQKAVALVKWQKSEIERLNIYLNTFGLALKNLEKERREVAREIFEEIEKIIDEKYNHYVFGNNDLDSIEQDAIINFSDSISECFTQLKNKYTATEPNN